jgi:glucosamine--fructose-6-phosphate aminotransferase (isomerizing)
VTDQRDGFTEAAEARRRHVAFVGMGSSYDACYPAITHLAGAGIVALMLDAAEALHFRLPMLGEDDLLVLVSQSGESAETVRVAESLRRRGSAPTIVSITNGTQNRLARTSDVALDTRTGEEVGPSTMTFATSLVTAGALARTLAGEDVDGVIGRLVNDAEQAAISMEELLADEDLAEQMVEWHGDRATTVILGRGGARAAAEMGALTLKEAVGLPVESLQTAQFRHGPLELAGPELAAMVIATEPETVELDLGLVRELLSLRASVLAITTEDTAAPYAMQVPIGALDRLVAPAVAILPAQLLAWKLATIRGRRPGTYVHASKVTRHE